MVEGNVGGTAFDLVDATDTTRRGSNDSISSGAFFSCSEGEDSDTSNAVQEDGNDTQSTRSIRSWRSSRQISFLTGNTFRILPDRRPEQWDECEEDAHGPTFRTPPTLPPRNPQRRTLLAPSSIRTNLRGSISIQNEDTQGCNSVRPREDSKMEAFPLYSDLDFFIDDIRGQIEATEWEFRNEEQEFDFDRASILAPAPRRSFSAPDWVASVPSDIIPARLAICKEVRSTTPEQEKEQKRPAKKRFEYHPGTFMSNDVNVRDHEFRPSYMINQRMHSLTEVDLERISLMRVPIRDRIAALVKRSSARDIAKEQLWQTQRDSIDRQLGSGAVQKDKDSVLALDV